MKDPETSFPRISLRQARQTGGDPFQPQDTAVQARDCDLSETQNPQITMEFTQSSSMTAKD